MMTQIINGKEIAATLCEQIKEKVARLKGEAPCIALINASSDPASEIYVSKKEKLAASVGISSVVYKLGSNAEEGEIADLIHQLNNDNNVHAILLQSPLAKGISFSKLVNLIRPDKDVDGLTFVNQGKLFAGESGVIPCTPLGVLHLIKTVHERIAGLHAVVIGRSAIVGRPLAQLLINFNCSVMVLHSHSKNIPEICKTADILVSAVGKPFFVKKNFVKPGATVIDVGVNRIEKEEKKKIVGDVDFDEVYGIAGAITPVPNGVGPMTVAYLMHNALELANNFGANRV